jgi:hypothetical protein
LATLSGTETGVRAMARILSEWEPPAGMVVYEIRVLVIEAEKRVLASVVLRCGDGRLVRAGTVLDFCTGKSPEQIHAELTESLKHG